MIPNVKKTNQDSHVEIKDLAGIKGLWMFGVMDGHGINGHFVSDFVRKHLPSVLSNLIEGGNGYEIFNTRSSLASGKKPLKKQIKANNYMNDQWITSDIRDIHIREAFKITQEKIE